MLFTFIQWYIHENKLVCIYYDGHLMEEDRGWTSVTCMGDMRNAYISVRPCGEIIQKAYAWMGG
jgi:hypothetical protein